MFKFNKCRWLSLLRGEFLQGRNRLGLAHSFSNSRMFEHRLLMAVATSEASQTPVNKSPAPSNSIGESVQPRKKKPRFDFWRCFWLTILVLSFPLVWYCYYVPSNEIAWADDYTSAQQQAQESGKPIILYFTGQWCVPCRIMKREVWADEQVAASVNEQFVPVSIDVDNPHDADILARYQVVGPPVTIVTDAQGNVLDWRAGGINKSEFHDLLETSTSLDARDLQANLPSQAVKPDSIH